MKAAFYSLARWFFKGFVLHLLFSFLVPQREVLFLSRQVDETRIQLRSLGSEVPAKKGWIVSPI